jgi:hypothetical protein
MKRFPDWERRLLGWHSEWRRRAHAWATADCGCMTAAEIMAISDCPDPMAELRGRYSDAAGNLLLLRELGFDSPGAYVASKFEEYPSPAFARRGDIGVADGLKHGPLVVCLGHHVVGIGPDGLIALPRQQLTRAFKIG